MVTETALAEIDVIEESFLANIERGEQALAAAETDYERLQVRDAARAAQVITMIMGRRKLVRRFSVLVQRAERAIAQVNPPLAPEESVRLRGNSVAAEEARAEREALLAERAASGLTDRDLSNYRYAHSHLSDEEFETLASEDTDDPMTRRQLIEIGRERRDELRREQREQQRQEALQEQVEKGDQVPNVGEMTKAQASVEVGMHSRVVFCDNLDPDNGLPSLPDAAVALTFTSPPYWTFAEYGDLGVGYESSYVGYIESLRKVFAAVWQKTIPGGRAVVNISNMKSKLEEEGAARIYPIVADLIHVMTNIGFTFFDELIWAKRDTTTGPMAGSPLWGSYPYPPTPKILDSTFENILVFTKPGQRNVALGVKEQSRLSVEEWREYTKGVWRVESGSTPNHPATFPMEIADRIIKMYSFVNDVVLDPFAGSGTTIVSAEANRRAGIGYEISRPYEILVKDRAAGHLAGLNGVA